VKKKLSAFIAGKMLGVMAASSALSVTDSGRHAALPVSKVLNVAYREVNLGGTLSKDQLKQMFEATKLKRQRAAEARGVRMEGRTGDLDVI